ncbi:beta-ketoacyl-ACP synthase III [Liquorilactobacillus capillatus]|uniref:Beta-ketoacyl-[acyl-carrier-protein] synthase III n=1 Tax=Liquorilactobacillus capillatus DSM 19910 TaxID=1423731 RepID=A0A0R1M468_9LACO|nr:beta-ketoacyl-ACP synthase III [Liquorilactobacillus capillatus]KRL02782.1 3-oxoacyl-(acyl carrier protein) synthase III [Liquorilactobacillus capillatus DSM 19910]
MEKAVKITESAHYVPQRIVTNDELSQLMETSDEWIQRHTGIKTRHFALNENTSDMCVKVAKKLLTAARLSATELDLIVVATITPDSLTPSTAARVQQKIGADKAFSFDISAACAGFVFALSTAEKFIRNGNYKRALVIAAETNSKMMDFKDRTSAVFFGDGAGGVLLEGSENPADEMFMAEALKTKADSEVIHSGRISPLSQITADNYPKIDAFYQNGHAVFDFVTAVIPKHIKQLLKKQHLRPVDLDLIIPHQANLRLIENIAQQLQLPLTKFATNIETNGNTSSAGIPIGLDQVLKQEKQHKLILLTGFGAGLAYGSLLLDVASFHRQDSSK